MRLVGLELCVVVAQKGEGVPGKGAPPLDVVLVLPEDKGSAALPDDEGHVFQLVAGHAFHADALPSPDLFVVCGKRLCQFDWIEEAALLVAEIAGARFVFLARLGAWYDYDPKGEAARSGFALLGVAIDKSVEQPLGILDGLQFALLLKVLPDDLARGNRVFQHWEGWLTKNKRRRTRMGMRMRRSACWLLLLLSFL